MMDMWLFSESKLRTKFDTISKNQDVKNNIIYLNMTLIILFFNKSDMSC